MCKPTEIQEMAAGSGWLDDSPWREGEKRGGVGRGGQRKGAEEERVGEVRREDEREEGGEGKKGMCCVCVGASAVGGLGLDPVRLWKAWYGVWT